MVWVGACFFEKRHAKTTFDWERGGPCRSLFLKMTDASCETLRFCFLIRCSGYGRKLFLGSVSQNDGSVARTLRFWFLVRFSGFGRKVFLGSGSQNGGSVARNAPFLVSSMIFWTWSEGVSWIWFSEWRKRRAKRSVSGF